MRFITTRGLAGLAWGCSSDHPVVATIGDGRFAHSWAELETFVRFGIALAVMIAFWDSRSMPKPLS
ncbi:thiamine pyrophosphate-dependent enzyme [Mesorhizobium sp. 131-3-5]|uniref:thiamine pyrophosphate-dependent enzyme n=1 Tax=Mesorhizobium sp. 131-3-5 TaxID=2744520 RepID=UPI001FD5B799|nr:thiamine pyrophosphate-dependent enzyme [Mesorhizobium sp. 131-3-5]